MISERDEQQAEVLEEYCQALMADPASPPPAGLEPELARAASVLRQQMRAPLPSARFAAALQAQLEEESATPTAISEAEVLSPAKPMPRPLYIARATVGWLAAAVLIVLAVAGVLYMASDLASRAERQSLPLQPEAHSAAEIIARSKAMYQSDAIKSFELTEVNTMDSAPNWKDEQRIFYQAPNLSRVEDNWGITIDYDNTTWNYAAPRWIDYGGDVAINGFVAVPMSLRQPLRNNIETLNAQLYNIDGCYQPTLTGKDTIAGRSAYVLDMGEALPGCKVGGLDGYGKWVIWIDHDSYFILRTDLHYKNSPGAVTTVVTSIQYNLSLNTDLFTFAMPKNVNFSDSRPISTTSDTQLRAFTAEDSSNITFSSYLPGYLPKGLRPAGLRYNVQDSILTIAYRNPVQQPFAPKPPEGYFDFGVYINVPQPLNPWLSVNMEQATAPAVANETKNLHGTAIGGTQGWIGCAYPGIAGSCQMENMEAVVIRGSTLISVSGSGITQDDLIKVAASLTLLQPAPAKGPAFPTMPTIPTPLPTLPVQQDNTMP